MRRLLFDSISLAALVWPSLGQVSQAQLVQVRPGFVKAPFVRVYRYPDGSSFVRAPFVAVRSPGYPVVHPYVAPLDTDCNQMDWGLLSQAVRQRSAELDAQLNRFPAGETLRSQIKTSEIVALVPPQLEDAPAEEVRQKLHEILTSYNSPNDSAEFQQVARLASFQRLRAALEEYTTPSHQRLRRQLFVAAGNLNRSLSPFNTGRGWQEYLQLLPGMLLSSDKAEDTETPLSQADLADALNRFDAISQRDDYRVITDLPAFKTTHERLAAFIKLSQPLTEGLPEELPAPMPEIES